MLHHSLTASISLTEAERKEIHEQLERLLSNPHFNQSRRFPSFLRFVIDQTLAGRPEMLKERTLGIEIFGREADYDTASDPIVRVTATEIRKRIAQYYQEPGHETELRVSLPAGSYVPQFHWPQAASHNVSHVETILPLPISVPLVIPIPAEIEKAAVPAENTRRWFRRPAAALLLIPFVLLCVGTAFLWRPSPPSPFEFFWGPILNTNDPVMFCVADQREYPVISLRDATDPSKQTLLKDNLTAIVLDDLNPVVRVASLLESKAKTFSLKGEGTTDLEELRGGPTIFIGAFDNAWTLRLTGPLRYHFANNPQMTEFRIVDSMHPASLGWAIDRPQQLATNNYRDFALIARFTDSTTGRIAVVAAGVGRGGNENRRRVPYGCQRSGAA